VERGGEEDFPLKNSSYVTFFLHHPNNYESDESSNIAWTLQMLLPGFVVLDESINVEEYLSFLRLRSFKTFQSGSVETINLRDDVMVVKRELEGYETFLAVMNLGSEETEVDLNGIVDEAKSRKVAAASSGSSYTIG
jgi:hypothetical protein